MPNQYHKYYKLAINGHYESFYRQFTSRYIFTIYSTTNLLFLLFFFGSVQSQSNSHRKVDGISLDVRINLKSAVACYKQCPATATSLSALKLCTSYASIYTIQLCICQTHSYLAKWVPGCFE